MSSRRALVGALVVGCLSALAHAQVFEIVDENDVTVVSVPTGDSGSHLSAWDGSEMLDLVDEIKSLRAQVDDINALLAQCPCATPAPTPQPLPPVQQTTTLCSPRFYTFTDNHKDGEYVDVPIRRPYALSDVDRVTISLELPNSVSYPYLEHIRIELHNENGWITLFDSGTCARTGMNVVFEDSGTPVATACTGTQINDLVGTFRPADRLASLPPADSGFFLRVFDDENVPFTNDEFKISDVCIGFVPSTTPGPTPRQRCNHVDYALPPNHSNSDFIDAALPVPQTFSSLRSITLALNFPGSVSGPYLYQVKVEVGNDYGVITLFDGSLDNGCFRGGLDVTFSDDIYLPYLSTNCDGVASSSISGDFQPVDPLFNLAPAYDGFFLRVTDSYNVGQTKDEPILRFGCVIYNAELTPAPTPAPLCNTNGYTFTSKASDGAEISIPLPDPTKWTRAKSISIHIGLVNQANYPYIYQAQILLKNINDQITLFDGNDHPNICQRDGLDVTFRDDAPEFLHTVCDGVAPSTIEGAFRPLEPLSSIVGASSGWEVVVIDQFNAVNTDDDIKIFDVCVQWV